MQSCGLHNLEDSGGLSRALAATSLPDSRVGGRGAMHCDLLLFRLYVHVPSITFYTFPPPGLPASMSVCGCGRQPELPGKEARRVLVTEGGSSL